MFANRAAGSIGRLQQHFAGPSAILTLRRQGRGLVNPLTGAAIAALAVNGLTAAGAESIDLDAAAIQGVLGEGFQFTIDGDGTTYEVQADVTASANALASVSISPALAAEAANNAAVTITRFYGEWSFLAMRRGFRDDLVDGTTIQQGDYQLIVPLEGGAPVVPKPTDKLAFDGESVSLVQILTVKPGDTAAAWRFHCRG